MDFLLLITNAAGTRTGPAAAIGASLTLTLTLILTQVGGNTNI
jgi:hypothetical protein